MNFNIPEWIYRLKKEANVYQKDREILVQAGAAISRGDFEAAGRFLLPLAKEYKLLKMEPPM